MQHRPHQMVWIAALSQLVLDATGFLSGMTPGQAMKEIGAARRGLLKFEKMQRCFTSAQWARYNATHAGGIPAMVEAAIIDADDFAGSIRVARASGWSRFGDRDAALIGMNSRVSRPHFVVDLVPADGEPPFVLPDGVHNRESYERWAKRQSLDMAEYNSDCAIVINDGFVSRTDPACLIHASE